MNIMQTRLIDMTRDEFEKGMTLLKNVYGHSKYAEDRTYYFLKILEPVNGEVWIEKIKHYCAVSDRAPLLNELKEVFRSELENHLSEKLKKASENMEFCQRCENSGVQTYYSKETGYPFAFQCLCEFGKILRPNFPKQYPGILETHYNHKQWVNGQFTNPLMEKNFTNKKRNYGDLKAANFSNISEKNH